MVNDPIKMGFWETTWEKVDEQARKDEVLAKVAPMDTLEKACVLAYIGQSTNHEQYRGIAICRVCGQGRSLAVGGADRGI